MNRNEDYMEAVTLTPNERYAISAVSTMHSHLGNVLELARYYNQLSPAQWHELQECVLNMLVTLRQRNRR